MILAGLEEMERPVCRGVGFVEEEYEVVLGPEPWPWPFRLSTYTTTICCMGSCLFYCGKGILEDLVQCVFQALCCSPWILLILLPVLNAKGSKAPRTDMETFTINELDVTGTSVYLASGNFTVIFQAHNPSSVVGFRHRYLSTLVTVFYQDTQLGQSAEVPRFTQGYKSARNVSADVDFKEQRLDEPVALSLMKDLQQTQAGVGFRITVDAYVKVKRLGWHGPSWFNVTCSVEATQTGTLLSKDCL